MVQGHAYGLALVLEDEDVIDLFAGAKLSVAIGPDLDQVPYAALAHGRKSRIMVVRVEDDLADATTWGRWRQVAALLVGYLGVRGEGGIPVLEDNYVVVLPGNLSGKAAWLRRAQGTV